MTGSLARLAICALWIAGPGPSRVPTPTPAPGREAESQREAGHERSEAAESAEEGVRITGALEAILRGAAPVTDFRFRLEWVLEGELFSLSVDGDGGVAIWNNRSQFTLTRDELLDLVRSLEASGIGAMRSRYGDEEAERLAFRGRLTVAAGSAVKHVVQLVGGQQFEPLAAFALRTLDGARPKASRGASASSLDDGLRKVAAGELAPQAFEVVFQTRDDRSVADPEEGLLLRIAGRKAVARVFRPKGGYGSPRRRVLAAAEFADLVAALRRGHPEAFGQGLFAPRYTDVRIRVLDRSKDVQARRYLDVTPQTHGQVQEAFDRVAAELERIARRTVAEGVEATDED